MQQVLTIISVIIIFFSPACFAADSDTLSSEHLLVKVINSSSHTCQLSKKPQMHGGILTQSPEEGAFIEPGQAHRFIFYVGNLGPLAEFNYSCAGDAFAFLAAQTSRNFGSDINAEILLPPSTHYLQYYFVRNSTEYEVPGQVTWIIWD